jgi:hypothetical protein
VRGRLLGGLLLLVAASAEAHFHGGLEVGLHELRFRQGPGTALAEEAFEVRNAGNATFAGLIYAWLPDDATLTMFELAGLPPQPNASGRGLVAFDLAAANASLAPGEVRNASLAWSAPLAEGGKVARRIVYPTDRLLAEAEAPLRITRAPSQGFVGMGGVVEVQGAPAQGLEGWHVLAAVVALLLVGAWWWDRRRRPRP